MLCRLVFPAVLWISMTDGLLSNLTNIARTLPEFQRDEKCVPGHTYKIDCNTCFCKNDGSLMCTKVLCIPPKDGRKRNGVITTLNIKKETTHHIPHLPKKNCVPGKIYRKGCQMCFCEDNKRAVCTKDKNCKRLTARGFKIYRLENIRPPFLPGEVENLPKLPHRQVKCQPGKSYKVDCNACICRASHNLICDDLICMSYDDMHRIEANKKSKDVCKPQTYRKTRENCIECDCVKRKLKCNIIVGCISEKDKKLPNWNNGKPKLSLEMFKETCIPGGVYRKDCNNCYCQDDSLLRCTQKLCPNYTQSKALEKMRSYLIEHGLF